MTPIWMMLVSASLGAALGWGFVTGMTKWSKHQRSFSKYYDPDSVSSALITICRAQGREYNGDFHLDEFAQLLGYKNFRKYIYKVTSEQANTVRALAGPHGNAIYKAILARRKK